jgi:hypothetical protein
MEPTSDELGNSYDVDVKDYDPRCCSCGNGGSANDCENDCMDGYENEGQNYIVDDHDMPNVDNDQDSDNEWDIDYPEDESGSEQEGDEPDLEEEESDLEDEGESCGDDEGCSREVDLLDQLYNDVAHTEDILLDDEDGIFLSEETLASGDNGSHEVDLGVWN